MGIYVQGKVQQQGQLAPVPQQKVTAPTQQLVPNTSVTNDSAVERGMEQYRSPFHQPPSPTRSNAGQQVAATPEQSRTVRAHSFHVYGNKAALDVKVSSKIKRSEIGIVDENGRDARFHTLMLELAPASGNRQYNWSNKVAIQLTRDELPLVIGVFFGWLNKVKFSNHGLPSEAQKKWFSIEHQQLKVFYSAGVANGVNGALPIPLTSASQIGLVALESYCKNYPGVDTNTVLGTIKMICQTYLQQCNGVIEDKLPTR